MLEKLDEKANFVTKRENLFFSLKKVPKKFSGFVEKLYLCIRFRPKKPGATKERVL